MPPDRCVLGVAWDFVAEAEPITVRNRNPGGNSAAVADRYTYGNPNADRNANASTLFLAGCRRRLHAAIPNPIRRSACADCRNVRWWLWWKRFVAGRIVWGWRAYHRGGSLPH